MIPARQAIERLQQGNRRFLAGVRSRDMLATPTRRAELAASQNPFAIILGCSDSRVPVELIFDQGLGDLFVIRIAGNVIGPSVIGSVEFGADHLGARLVVVLGHSHCGAVSATLDELENPAEIDSENLRSIVDEIRPSVEPLMSGPERDPETLLRKAIRANVRASVSRLQQGSPVLERLIETDGLLVVGAEYSLVGGDVEFFDSP